jgi:hypothetical protein
MKGEGMARKRRREERNRVEMEKGKAMNVRGEN